MKKYIFFMFFLTIILMIQLIHSHVPENTGDDTKSMLDTKNVTCAPTDSEINQKIQKQVEWVRCLFGPLFTWCKKSTKIKISC